MFSNVNAHFLSLPPNKGPIRLHITCSRNVNGYYFGFSDECMMMGDSFGDCGDKFKTITHMSKSRHFNFDIFSNIV